MGPFDERRKDIKLEIGRGFKGKCNKNIKEKQPAWGMNVSRKKTCFRVDVSRKKDCLSRMFLGEKS